MKKLTLLALLITTSLSAQVGINTVTPQETLHVAGTTRIDALNNTNPLNNGVNTNVSVDINGTLILDKKIQGKVSASGNAIKITGATCSRLSNGDYSIVFNNTMLDSDYVILLSNSNTGGFGATIVSYYNQTTTGFNVKLKDAFWLIDVNVEFMFKIYK